MGNLFFSFFKPVEPNFFPLTRLAGNADFVVKIMYGPDICNINMVITIIVTVYFSMYLHAK